MKKFKKIFFTLLGSFILAFAVEEFLLPGNILSGGVSGVAVLLKPFITVISEEMIVIIINIVLFIIGCIFLGKEFAKTTALSSLSYSVFIFLLDRFFPHFSVEPLLCAIYGGLLVGLGVGMVIRQGGSTGGMDVPPLIVSKYFGLSVSKCIMVTDALTVIFGLWIYGVEEVLIGLINVYLSSVTLEKVVTSYGGASAKEIKIISDKYHEISKEIHDKLERGTTVLNASGGYTGDSKPILMVVVSEKQYDDAIEIIEKYDKSAFVVVSETRDVHGEGFTFESRA